MNLNDLSTQLLYTTVPVWTEAESGERGSATAFIYNVSVPDKSGLTVPLLITNYHVLANAKRAQIEMIERHDKSPARENRVRIELLTDMPQTSYDIALDIAVVPLGPAFKELEAANRPAFFHSITPDIIPQSESVDSFSAMEDIVFIGYPSGLRDDINANPLIRRGITSTPVWNDYQGDQVFLIDAGVYPGSSGSPVFILNQGAYPTSNGLSVGNRLFFLGMISQTIIRDDSRSQTYLGLGEVLKSSAIQGFVNKWVREVLGH